MMMTIRPGSRTVAAGTATWASTLANGDRSAWEESSPASGLLGQTARLRSEWGEGTGHLLIDDVFHTRIKGFEKRVRREAVTLGPEGLVACGTRVARFHAGELPHHPVGGLDQPSGGSIDFGGLVQDLPRLGKEPFGADLAAVAIQEGVSQVASDLSELVGFGLCSVMLPQLDPGMRVGAPLRQETERCAIGSRGQHGTGREVNADADHIVWLYTAFGQHRRNRRLEHVQVIVRVLQGPIRLEGHRGAR